MPSEPGLRFRPALAADRNAVTRLVFAVLAEYRLKPDPGGVDTDLEDIQASYHHRGGSFDVLEEPGGRIVGCVGIYPLDEPGVCELRKMYLHRDCRGRGLGRILLEHALNRARRLGFREVTLETASPLREAIALYESRGFQPCDSTHLADRCDQRYSLELRSGREKEI